MKTVQTLAVLALTPSLIFSSPVPAQAALTSHGDVNCVIEKVGTGRTAHYPYVQRWSTTSSSPARHWLLRVRVDVDCEPAHKVAALRGSVQIERRITRTNGDHVWVGVGNADVTQDSEDAHRGHVTMQPNGVGIPGTAWYRWSLDLDAIGTPRVIGNKIRGFKGPQVRITLPTAQELSP